MRTSSSKMMAFSQPMSRTRCKAATCFMAQDFCPMESGASGLNQRRSISAVISAASKSNTQPQTLLILLSSPISGAARSDSERV